MTFKAFLTSQVDKSVKSEFVDFNLDQLDAGEVVIRTEYSTVNYKDALSATGAGKIIRRWPCVGGVDLAGAVESSTDPAFKVGDKVIAHGYDVGVAHHGGYAERARIPSKWLVRLPSGMSTFEAMSLGTAGFTAAQAIHRMEHDGLSPSKGPVIVNGVTGGVGMVALDLLKKLGYEIHAVTGKEKDEELLKSMGATKVFLRQTMDMPEKPLLAETYAGAIDNLGGPMLGYFTRVMKNGGTIASIGLAAGWELHTTVMPFILRGVSLLGIDSVNCPMALRQQIWNKLAVEWKSVNLAAQVKTVEFKDIASTFDAYVKGQVTGRTVVKIA
jgi:acrylyl-CoA reductase (NADPH)